MAEPRFLLDSNVCIYLLEGLSDEARVRSERCRPGELVTSSIAYAEVIRGLPAWSDAAEGAIAAFFDIVAIEPFDAAAARHCRQVPFRRGKFDRLIAAHAMALDLTLVTNNERDLADVPGLRVEDWTLPL
ncbi:MAG: type II toxin-antitoxin system VapC family toxin [Sphingomonas sp.]